MSNDSLSRIEIAHHTGLSPSTLTTLISELLEENILIETGRETFTGGRRRKELTINPDHGVIVIVEVGRQGSSIHFFDMLLQKCEEKKLVSGGASGNRLLSAITTSVSSFIDREDNSRNISGVGLLFQEDMQDEEINVMFSTSLSTDVISLKDALHSQFHVPVLEEYSIAYSIVEALAAESICSDEKNRAHISIAGDVLASVYVDGKVLPMKNGETINLTDIAYDFDKDLPSVVPGLAQRVASLIALLCSMFSLEEVLLSGNKIHSSGFIRTVDDSLDVMMPDRPPIRHIKLPHVESIDLFTEKIRKASFLGIT